MSEKICKCGSVYYESWKTSCLSCFIKGKKEERRQDKAKRTLESGIAKANFKMERPGLDFAHLGLSHVSQHHREIKKLKREIRAKDINCRHNPDAFLQDYEKVLSEKTNKTLTNEKKTVCLENSDNCAITTNHASQELSGKRISASETANGISDLTPPARVKDIEPDLIKLDRLPKERPRHSEAWVPGRVKYNAGTINLGKMPLRIQHSECWNHRTGYSKPIPKTDEEWVEIPNNINKMWKLVSKP
jgi:hypothetical protein